MYIYIYIYVLFHSVKFKFVSGKPCFESSNEEVILRMAVNNKLYLIAM